MERTDVLVVGGGLVGFSAALHLRESGRDVTIVAPSHPGMASRAAVGMLAPTSEWNGWMSRDWLELLILARDYYPSLLARLGLERADAEAEVGYRPLDFLYLDLLERDEDMSRHCDALQAVGLRVAPLDPIETLALEPAMSLSAIRGSLLMEGDAVVNPRALLGALVAAVETMGVRTIDESVESLEVTTDEVRLSTAAGVMRANHLVVAAGAWSREIGSMLGLEIPVSPVRGQIIELQARPGIVRNCIYMAAGACGSIVERAPGTYIVGTSEECGGGDSTTTSRVVAAILTRTNAVVPELGDAAVTDMWSGFRPTTPDEMPIIDTVFGGRIVIATGHYRNGVLLAPLTGLLVRDLIEGKEPPLDLTPYRFTREFVPQYYLAARY